MKKLEGLIAAPFVPFNPAGEIKTEWIAPYFEFLKGNHITGVFINGTTGEGVSLSQGERMKITEAWAEAARGSQFKTIVMVGGTSYVESIENALHANSEGVDAIAITAPYFFKPANALQLAEFCARVAEMVPNLPVYYYHIPVFTGCSVPMIDFLMAADSIIPNLKGIKYTHEDFMDFLSCIHFLNGKYDMLWGRDECLLSALVLGTRAAVGSTYNYAAPLYHEMMASYERGDMIAARKLQQQSIDMIRLLSKYGGIATGKAFMNYIGFDFGRFRLPVSNLPAEEYESFVDDVEKLYMGKLFSKKF